MAMISSGHAALMSALEELGIDTKHTTKVIIEIGDGMVKLHIMAYATEQILGVVKAINGMDEVTIVNHGGE